MEVKDFEFNEDSAEAMQDRYILETERSPFSQQTQQKLQPLNANIKNLIINGNHYSLDHDLAEFRVIFRAITGAMRSDWYIHLTSKSQYENPIRQLFNWSQLVEIQVKNRYKILNMFEAHRVNIDKVKPQSTGVSQIVTLIREAIACGLVPSESVKYLEFLIGATKRSKTEEPEPTDLGSWFFSVNWLRNFLPEKDYLQLASPKVLMDSLSVTVATTLIDIIEAKKKLSKNNTIKSICTKEVNLSSKGSIARDFARDLVENAVQLDNDLQPIDTLSALIIQDCVHIGLVEFVTERLMTTPDGRLDSKSAGYKVPKDTRVNGGKRISCFITPRIFKKNNLMELSTVEQLLFSFLCAWQAVQPLDVIKLKKGDFAIIRNSLGRATHVQCTYYKSRAKIEHSPPLLSATSVEGKAIITYLNSSNALSNPPLTPDLKSTQQVFSQSDGSDNFVLSRVWADKMLAQRVRDQLKKTNTSDVFRKAIIKMHQNGGQTKSAWVNKQANNNSTEDYRLAVKNPVPCGWIGLQMIKTSAVYSKTDLYRADDLSNQNSHSAETEKLSYLTENNMEWKNQHGRISRLVMTYLTKVAFAPSIKHSLRLAEEMKVRSRVLATTGSDGDSKMTLKGEAIIVNTPDNYEPDELYVWDSAETVLIMRHYISEAERQASSLITHCTTLFENTVLPTAEWMMYVINNLLSPMIVREGDNAYEEFKEDLPPLFESEIRSRAV